MKFAADAMLGRLAKWLRITGYDTLFIKDIEDGDLVKIARSEGRLILTRDTGLVRNLAPSKYLLIREDDPFRQLRQAVKELGLPVREEALLSICINCNAPVKDIEKEKVRGLVPDFVFERADSFTRCPCCGRVYWSGTHGQRILKRLESLGIEIARKPIG